MALLLVTGTRFADMGHAWDIYQAITAIKPAKATTKKPASAKAEPKSDTAKSSSAKSSSEKPAEKPAQVQ